MNPNVDQNERTRLKAANQWHRLVTPLALLVAFASIAVNFYLILNEKTVVTPPVVERGYWIAGGRANQEYLADMGDFVLQTLKTTSPGKVDFENKKILQMVNPENYAQVKTDLDAEAIRIKSNNLTTVWEPQTVDVDVDGLRVTWSGVLKKWVADKPMPPATRTFYVDFTISRQGKLHVKTAGKEVERAQSGL